MNKIKRIFCPVFLVGLPFIILSALSFYLHSIEFASHSSPETGGKPYPTQLIRISSFGHLPVVTDWFWLSALADSSLVHLPPGIHPAVYYKYLLVTELDPAYKIVYEAGASLLTIARKDGLGAKKLLTKGISFFNSVVPSYSKDFQKKYWDRPWSLYILLGYVELYELKNMPAAAEAFRTAATLPNAPAYLSSLSRKLSVVGGAYDVGLQLLAFMMKGNKDPAFLERAAQEHQDLQVGRMLFHINYQFREFLRTELRKTPKKELAFFWQKFVNQKAVPLRDPWNGTISLDPTTKKIISTTPHKTVLGLD